jgi:enoyl-CoA hydratase
MRDQPTVSYSGQGAVAVVTIERPSVRNAIDQPTRQALADAFRRFDREPAHCIAVLT